MQLTKKKRANHGERTAPAKTAEMILGGGWVGRGLGLAYIGIEDGGRVEGMRRAQRGRDACSALPCLDVAMLHSHVLCA